MAKRGICKKCGREITLYGRGLCSKCHREEYGFPGASNKTSENNDCLKITIDFSLHADLLEDLREIARIEIRDLTHQILWCVKHYVDTVGKQTIEKEV